MPAGRITAAVIHAAHETVLLERDGDGEPADPRVFIVLIVVLQDPSQHKHIVNPVPETGPIQHLIRAAGVVPAMPVRIAARQQQHTQASVITSGP